MRRGGSGAIDFSDFFKKAMNCHPYPWQDSIAEEGLPTVLDVPTGMGKTEGVALAWAWRRLAKGDEPRHLIYCLPMRVLVRQTTERLQACFSSLHRSGAIEAEVPVHVLMGGDIQEEWERHPETSWILVGTQDQLLSRALNRGYSMNPYSWPIHFALLNNDCRWVLDEIQLMGPGLWTTAQLDWMREKRFRPLFSCRTTWMSATLGTGFLATYDRKTDNCDKPEPFRMSWKLPDRVPAALRQRWGQLAGAKRPAEIVRPPSGKKAGPLHEWLAARVLGEHAPGTLSLVICNTIQRAQQLFKEVRAKAPMQEDRGPMPLLLTSRFRSRDRSEAEQILHEFENARRSSKNARVSDHPGLVCVSTQVVEAGVDVSARRLWSEIAPWPAIVQRLGRLNRDGKEGEARGYFWPYDSPAKGTNRSGPYTTTDLQEAEKLLKAYERLSCKCRAREALDGLASGKLGKAYADALAPAEWPYPRAFDVHGLFATERDVHGGYTDVSHFIRGGDPEADVTVFWRQWPGKSPPRADDLIGPPFDAEEGCSVGVWNLRDFLSGGKGRPAWLWNADRGAWERVRPVDVRGGMLLMLSRDTGGYDASLGWTGESGHVLADVPAAAPGRAHNDDPSTEVGYWASLDSHLADTRREAISLVSSLDLPQDLRTAVIEAAGWHDIGKAHPRWQEALPVRKGRGLLAKCPRVLRIKTAPADADSVTGKVEPELSGAERLPDQVNGTDAVWLRWALPQRLSSNQLERLRALPGVRYAAHRAFRPGLRHEAASALAMWARYRFGSAGWPALAVYLAAAHHGKVRTVLRARTDVGTDVFGVVRDSAPLRLGKDIWSLDFTCAQDGAGGEWSGDEFRITEPGWTALVTDLLGPWGPDEPWDTGTVPPAEPRALGPFVVAYLEAVVRTADWRASDSPSGASYPSPTPAPAEAPHGA